MTSGTFLSPQLRATACGLSVALLALISSSGLATTYVELAIEEMASKADMAFHGTVTEIEVADRDGEPWTLVTFAVIESLSGDIEESVALELLGGTLDNGVSVSVVGIPEFRSGDEVIVLAYDGSYVSPVVGFNQGLWRLTARGFEDERGTLLSLDEDGRLIEDGDGGASDEILAALRELIEDGS